MTTSQSFLAEVRRLAARVLTLLTGRTRLASVIPNPRKTLVGMAYWARTHRELWEYQESRPVQYRQRPRFVYDCSGAVCWLYWAAGLRDPSGNGYSGSNTYTGSLLAHGARVAPEMVRAGDICILGAEMPTAEQHAMMALEQGPNPVCFSHGRPGDPSFVRPSVDARSKTWVRVDTHRTHTIRWPKAR